MALLGIGACALAIRLAYVIAVVGDDPVAGDAIYYSAQAEMITRGAWFEHPFTGEPAADHPPVTALALALPSVGGGDPLFAQRVFMALLGTLVVAAVGAVGREVAGRPGGLVAAGAAAAYPGLWVNDGLAMSETPTALVTALLLLVAIRWRRGASPSWLLGVLGGVAVLTRVELILLVAVVALARRRPDPWPWRQHARLTGGVVVAAALVVAPWTARNLVRFEEPVLVSTNDGLTLRGANCDPAYHDAVGFWYLQCAEPVAGDQSEVSAEYRAQALAYIGDNLDRLPTVVVARVARVWSLYEPDAMTVLNRGEGRPRTASWMATIAWWLLAPAAAAALVVLARRRGPVLVLAAPFATVTAVAALTYGIPRFRLPAEVAALALLAAFASRARPEVDRALGAEHDPPSGLGAPPRPRS